MQHQVYTGGTWDDGTDDGSKVGTLEPPQPKGHCCRSGTGVCASIFASLHAHHDRPPDHLLQGIEKAMRNVEDGIMPDEAKTKHGKCRLVLLQVENPRVKTSHALHHVLSNMCQW